MILEIILGLILYILCGIGFREYVKPTGQKLSYIISVGWPLVAIVQFLVEGGRKAWNYIKNYFN